MLISIPSSLWLDCGHKPYFATARRRLKYKGGSQEGSIGRMTYRRMMDRKTPWECLINKRFVCWAELSFNLSVGLHLAVCHSSLLLQWDKNWCRDINQPDQTKPIMVFPFYCITEHFTSILQRENLKKLKTKTSLFSLHSSNSVCLSPSLNELHLD